MSLENIKLTPMMEQWVDAKNKFPDAILLFRMGDFYELFGDDAIRAAPILDLALTSRDKDKSGLKMAGFPFHSKDNYIVKLVEAGFKVAICEQLEDPKASKGIVKRGITNVITPGTMLETEAGDSDAAVVLGLLCDGSATVLCALDVATGNFQITSSSFIDKIHEEALRLPLKEIVLYADDTYAHEIVARVKQIKPSLFITKREKTVRRSDSREFLSVSFSELENSAINLILSYIAELKGCVPSHISIPRRYSIESQLLMDDATRKNLDLLPKKKGDSYNLFSVINDTKTPMGKRALAHTISAPETCLQEIIRRHELVENLVLDPELLRSVQDCLSGMYDIEKLTALTAASRVSPRGLSQLRDSLSSVLGLKSIASKTSSNTVYALCQAIPDLSELACELTKALFELPPLSLKDGEVFKSGYNHERDELFNILENSQQLLLDLEKKERENTSISSLKIKYTRVFGYYIEVTKTHLHKVPSHYQRKQTIANGERYVTDELILLEVKINTAQAQISSVEERLFEELRLKVSNKASELIQASRIIALLDLVASFAKVAQVKGFVRPKMLSKEARLLKIKAGRHPIIETMFLKNGSFFTPNDGELNEKNLIMLITGPNMAGKSTIMRQTALIQILAQMGAFVPAEEASISICDAIFARVGASDDLTTGRSTFMVEMTETATILAHATAHSLIILDEIGRGTSTYDGLSLAQATLEYIHERVKARTLFATHYHEMTELQQRLLGVKNFHVEIEEKKQEINFLYSLKEGPCLKSFGIKVARLSGMPLEVLERAETILSSLEQKACVGSSLPRVQEAVMPQLKFFDDPIIIDKILGLDINRLTPLQALNKLALWQSELKSKTRSMDLTRQ